jgi:hypothetical protein
MNTFAARHVSKLAAGVCLLVLAAPGVALSQNELGRVGERDLQLAEAIERAELEYGPHAPELIEPLTALSLLYEEEGKHVLGDVTTERLLSVIRANYGLYSLEQAPAMRLLMSHELERGNSARAWEIEKELMRLGVRNPDDVRTARIFRDVGDRRIDILKRYNAGELPDEIELGCYYNDSNEYRRAARRGAQSLHTAPGQQVGNGCAAGSKRVARRALAAEADTLYMAAIEVYQRNDLVTSDEYRELLNGLVRTSHDHFPPHSERRSLMQLMESYPEGSQPRIRTLVQLADWKLFYSGDFGTRFRDAALADYAQAYAQLLERGIAQAAIDAMFSPDVPIMLPSFESNPIVSPETPRSSGHIDVEFVLTGEGRADEIEILDTTTSGMPKAARKELVNVIKRGQFRPIMADGRVVDSAPFVVRYFVND